jgi:predicted ATP-dependent endonuclease of OLD family
MVLKRVKIEAFKSVRKICELVVDDRITTLMGANDHGKSNLLHAIAHLNQENPFVSDDLNWDTKIVSQGSKLPSVVAEFHFDQVELDQLKTIVAEVEAKTNKPAETSGPTRGSTDKTESTIPPDLSKLLVPQLQLAREGIPGELSVDGIRLDSLPDQVGKWFASTIPRFELIEAFSGNIQDEIDLQTIQQDSSEFVQGIFFRAGLQSDEWPSLFTHTDFNTKRLARASDVLNTHLQQMWGQGKLLQFRLQNKGDKIELKIDDPAVEGRRVPLSSKSTGITHFFRLSMMLHARKMKRPANAYLFLFDEPSLHLHPLGERDLLRAFEPLAVHSQFIIATHSLFMLNANFPERHRLVFLSEDGTSIDHKPYRSSWKRATDAFGIRAGSLALFSSRTLLVEGESDPMYLYELIRQLNALGMADADINQLGIVSYSNHPTLRYLIQLLSAEKEEQKIAVLLDGDNSGKSTARQIGELCKAHNVGILQLPEGHSTENLCLYRNHFFDAAIETILSACEAETGTVPKGVKERVDKAFDDYQKNGQILGETPKSAITLGKVFEKISKRFISESVAGLAP